MNFRNKRKEFAHNFLTITECSNEMYRKYHFIIESWGDRGTDIFKGDVHYKFHFLFSFSFVVCSADF